MIPFKFLKTLIFIWTYFVWRKLNHKTHKLFCNTLFQTLCRFFINSYVILQIVVWFLEILHKYNVEYSLYSKGMFSLVSSDDFIVSGRTFLQTIVKKNNALLYFIFNLSISTSEQFFNGMLMWHIFLTYCLFTWICNY